MKLKKFAGIFGGAVRSLINSPTFILAGLVLWIVLLGISKAGLILAPNFQTTLSNVVWTVFVAIVSLVLMSFFFAGVIGMAKKTSGKAGLKDFMFSARKFWLENLGVMLGVILVFNVLINGSLFVLTKVILTAEIFRVVGLIVSVGWLVGLIVFLTFASFFLVIDNLNILESAKKSAKLVKREYLATLCLLVVIFGVVFLLSKTPEFFGTFVEYVLFIPFAISLLTRFVLENRK